MKSFSARLIRTARTACILALVLATAGCALFIEDYEYLSPHRYLSLEGYEDATELARARVRPGPRQYLMGKIPVRYKIQRETYTLFFDLGERGETPGVNITVEPRDERKLVFVGVNGPDNWVEGVPKCVFGWDPRSQGENTWTYMLMNCDFERDRFERVIRLKVLDVEGTLVGEEAIPYTIEREGYFIAYPDGL